LLNPVVPLSSRSNIRLNWTAHPKVKRGSSSSDPDSLALGPGIEVDLSKDIPRDGDMLDLLMVKGTKRRDWDFLLIMSG